MLPGTLRYYFAASILFALSACAGRTPVPVTPVPVPQSYAIAPASIGAARPGELVYVADANGPVAAYSGSSNGKIKPVLTIPDPNIANAYWDPWGVSFDNAGNLYVQSFLSNATSYVFPPGAHAGTKPSRAFMGSGPDSRSIVVDSAGYEYVATSEQPGVIVVLAPGAHGVASNLYYVPPLRTIYADEAGWFPWPDILTTDSDNDVVAAVIRDRGNAIEVYPGGAKGSGTAIRTITGSRTNLGSCPGLVCDNIVVTFSSYTHMLYVGVSSGANAHVSVFAEEANSNVTPLRTIQGDETGLSNKVITGIAVSQRTGEIYVMAKDAQFDGAGKINVYSRTAGGDVKPVRCFTDGTTAFLNAEGIAVTR